MKTNMQNRVIKFRAWIPKKEFIENVIQDAYMAIQGTADLETLQSFMHHYGNEPLLMQFTGLTDKNGVEIYEGDVVEKCYGASVKTGVVAWHQERAMFILQDGFNEPLYQLPLNMIEVIGNLFENPELLNP